MKELRYASRFIAFLFILLFSVLILPALQAQHSLITKPIDETARVALRGNINPLIKTASDTGVVSDNTSTGTLLLLLGRSDTLQTTLDDFVKGASMPGSTNYHQ